MKRCIPLLISLCLLCCACAPKNQSTEYRVTEKEWAEESAFSLFKDAISAIFNTSSFSADYEGEVNGKRVSGHMDTEWLSSGTAGKAKAILYNLSETLTQNPQKEPNALSLEGNAQEINFLAARFLPQHPFTLTGASLRLAYHPDGRLNRGEISFASNRYTGNLHLTFHTVTRKEKR